MMVSVYTEQPRAAAAMQGVHRWSERTVLAQERGCCWRNDFRLSDLKYCRVHVLIRNATRIGVENYKIGKTILCSNTFEGSGDIVSLALPNQQLDGHAVV